MNIEPKQPGTKKNAIMAFSGIDVAFLLKFKFALLFGFKLLGLIKIGWIFSSFGSLFISLGGYPPKLDQAIETAGLNANLKVTAKTRFNNSFTSLAPNFINTKSVAILNCIVAPGGKFNHSVLAYELDINHRILTTIDPNNGITTAFRWRNLNLIVCITLITLA